LFFLLKKMFLLEGWLVTLNLYVFGFILYYARSMESSG